MIVVWITQFNNEYLKIFTHGDGKAVDVQLIGRRISPDL